MQVGHGLAQTLCTAHAQRTKRPHSISGVGQYGYQLDAKFLGCSKDSSPPQGEFEGQADCEGEWVAGWLGIPSRDGAQSEIGSSAIREAEHKPPDLKGVKTDERLLVIMDSEYEGDRGVIC